MDDAPVAPPTVAPAAAASPTPSAVYADDPRDGFLVRRLNRAITVMPVETIVSLAMMEGMSFTVTSSLLQAAGITFPTLFGIAFVVSMPLRRAALPKLSIAIPLSWVLARLAPPLTRVHLTRLKIRLGEGQLKRLRDRIVAAIKWTPSWVQKRRDTEAAEHQRMVAEAIAAGNPISTVPAPPLSNRGRFALKMTNLSDRYGLALLISYRLAGFCIVNSVYLALVYGIDITPLLQWMGVTANVHAVSSVSAYAAAVTMSALWFPITVFLAPYPAQLLHAVRTRLFPPKPTPVVTPTNTAAAAVTIADPAAPPAQTPDASSPPAPTAAPASDESSSQSSHPPSSKAFAVVALLLGTAAANAADDEAAAPAPSPSPSQTVPAVSFRRATASDLPSIVRLLVEDDLGSKRELALDLNDGAHSVAPCYATAFDAIDSEPQTHELIVGVSTQSGAVVACMQLSFLPNLTLQASTRALVEGVRVASSLRGQQVGRAMFAYAEQRAAAHGCKLMQLTTNVERPGAARFYQQLGYTPSHIGFKKAI